LIFGSSGFFANTGALLIYSIVARLIVNQEQILKLQQQNHQLELQTVHLEQYCKQLPDHSLITFCENIAAILHHYCALGFQNARYIYTTHILHLLII
jgi:hypothetical protein